MLTRVIKVGGSLFDLPDLGTRVQHWLKKQQPARSILVAGGGRLADEVRAQSVGDEHADHWACIEIMNATATNLAESLPGSRLIDALEALPQSDCVLVFAPSDWFRNREPFLPGTRLIESWDVTSDAIAARLAICLRADELVLLKSADPPSCDLQQLSDLGYVDKFLPKLAGELPPWKIVSLRSA